jgi:AcrR family transcriptional regulator
LSYGQIMTDAANSKRTELSSAGQRGPVEHERREQIIKAADEHFRHYGYGKTTVADLARAIGLSTAYIYKFFESKQAIGQAVCQLTLAEMVTDVRLVAQERGPRSDRLRRIFQTLARRGLGLFFNERKLHDIAVIACDEHWPTIDQYKADLAEILAGLIAEGRESGDFESKTPLDETVAAVLLTMSSFLHPMLLEECLDDAESQALTIANLVLRSLAP